jgi:hypothetical protein
MNHSNDTPAPDTAISAAIKWPISRICGDRLRTSSSSDSTNKPNNGNIIHHAQSWVSNIHPDNIPITRAMPPVRGIGLVCSERSFGISCIVLPLLKIRIKVITSVTKAEMNGR